MALPSTTETTAGTVAIMTAVIGTVVAIGIAAVDGTEAAIGTVREADGTVQAEAVGICLHLSVVVAMALTANKTDNFELRNAAKFAAFLLLYQVNVTRQT